MKIAVIGTQGIPAKYGGFETLAENLVSENHAGEIQYTVFCSSKNNTTKLPVYKNAVLKYIPLHANGIQSIVYDIVSFILSFLEYDVVLVLGVSGCIFLPVFRLFSKAKVIVNIDGLEHRRVKWTQLAKWFLKFSEAAAVKFAHTIIVDNKGIEDYVTETYKKKSVLIAYGGDHAQRQVTMEEEKEILSSYQLKQGQYSLAICRIEPENNCDMILEAFKQKGLPFVFVGNWNISHYSRDLKTKYEAVKNIRMIHSLYDLDSLYVLRKNCRFYIHGHSAGGTNPSLVEAMFFGIPILAFDCIYNKETTEYKAAYFRDEEELAGLLLSEVELFKNNGLAMKEIAARRYTWDVIISQYIALYSELNEMFRTKNN